MEQSDKSFDAKLAEIDGEYQAAAKQIDLDGLIALQEEHREKLIALLRDIHACNGTANDATSESAELDAHDRQGWQALARKRGAIVYGEMYAWAMLYACDLDLAHLRAGAVFGRRPAEILSSIWAGLLEASTAAACVDSGDDPPSQSGKMIPEPGAPD